MHSKFFAHIRHIPFGGPPAVPICGAWPPTLPIGGPTRATRTHVKHNGKHDMSSSATDSAPKSNKCWPTSHMSCCSCVCLCVWHVVCVWGVSVSFGFRFLRTHEHMDGCSFLTVCALPGRSRQSEKHPHYEVLMPTHFLRPQHLLPLPRSLAEHALLAPQ